MHLSIETLPPVLELEYMSGSVELVPDDTDTLTEENYVITSVNVDVSDPGITLNYTSDPTKLVVSGAYNNQFQHQLGYTEPQVDELTAPVEVFTSSWSEVPEPADTESIWFLFEYTPPASVSVTVTYEIEASWVEVDSTIITNPTQTDRSETFYISQVVSYDIATNITQFKKYYPD